MRQWRRYTGLEARKSVLIPGKAFGDAGGDRYLELLVLICFHHQQDPEDERRQADRRSRIPLRRLGQDLTLLSVRELQERIALLKEEIGRLEADIAKKQSSRNVADQFFKR